MKKSLLVILLMLSTWITYAQVPGTLSYQGILVDAGTGNPVTDGSHSVLFKFFKDPNGATRPDESFFRGPFLVTTYKGMFTIVIGAGTPSGNDPLITSPTDPNFIGGAQFFVEVTADGTAQSPRIKLSTVPYAFKAETASSMDAANLTGTLAPARIAAGDIDNTKLASGIDAAKLTTGTLPIARIADGTVTNAKLASGIDAAKVTTGTIAIANGGTNAATAAAARTNLGLVIGTDVQAFDADLTDLADGSLTGSKVDGTTLTSVSATNITTGTLALANGGTGATTAAAARTSLGAAASGANGDITSLTGLTTDLSVAQGGTGASTLTGAVIGNGASALTSVAASGGAQYFRRNSGNTAYEFGALSLSAGEIGTDAITNPKLADDAVNTAEIADLAITTPLIADDAVTAAKIGTAGAGDANKILTTDGSGNPQWVANGTTAIGLTASNGLTLSGNNLVLGGSALTANTFLSSGGFNFNFGGAGFFGIGSVAPLSKLAVGGNVAIGNTYEPLAAPTNGLIVQGNVGIGTNAPVNKLDIEGGVAIGATYSGTSAAPTNGLLVEGPIGVGTTTPTSSLLHLAGTTTVYNGLHFTTTLSGPNATDGFMIGPTTFNNNDMILWNYEVGAMTLGTSNVGRLFITSGGNIGVGTSPVSKLDVEGGTVIGATYAGTNGAPTNGLLVEGNVGLGTATATYPVTLYNSTDARVVNIEQDYAGASVQYGMTIDMQSGTGTSTKYGIDCNVSGTAASTGSIYGLETDISPNGTGTSYGLNSIIGNTTTGTGTRYAVYGLSYSGTAASNNGSIIGVYGYGYSSSTNSSGPVYGIYGVATDGGGTGTHYAGYFSGNVHVNGTLSKSAGTFKIDHPVDPENKYLNHSFVESPDMMNVYNGNIVTDATGLATVQLPEYFESLNKDFRYQLTVIKDFAQAIVWEEVSQNKFIIKTDKPNVKVSWQVTGIRNDPYAQQNPIKVEENKKQTDTGKYLNPEAYGKPAEMGINYQKPEKPNN